MVIFIKKTKRNFTQSRETTNFFSCGSGITACIDYLAYEIIGTTNQRQFMMVLGLNGDK
jgi:3-mercaptopyruvate sulfurtransferase SseA